MTPASHAGGPRFDPGWEYSVLLHKRTCTLGLVGYDICLTRRGSPVQFWEGVFKFSIFPVFYFGAVFISAPFHHYS